MRGKFPRDPTVCACCFSNAALLLFCALLLLLLDCWAAFCVRRGRSTSCRVAVNNRHWPCGGTMPASAYPWTLDGRHPGNYFDSHRLLGLQFMTWMTASSAVIRPLTLLAPARLGGGQHEDFCSSAPRIGGKGHGTRGLLAAEVCSLLLTPSFLQA